MEKILEDGSRKENYLLHSLKIMVVAVKDDERRNKGSSKGRKESLLAIITLMFTPIIRKRQMRVEDVLLVLVRGPIN